MATLLSRRRALALFGVGSLAATGSSAFLPPKDEVASTPAPLPLPYTRIKGEGTLAKNITLEGPWPNIALEIRPDGQIRAFRY